MADTCNPEWESIPMVAWQHSRALARYVDLHLVTQQVNAENIVRAGLVEGVDFTAIDTSSVATISSPSWSGWRACWSVEDACGTRWVMPSSCSAPTRSTRPATASGCSCT